VGGTGTHKNGSRKPYQDPPIPPHLLLRRCVTEGAGSKKAALAMAYKLLDSAQERWRRFTGHELVTDVLDGVKFKDGIRGTDDQTTTTDEKVAA
jgi:hypothetical protein